MSKRNALCPCGSGFKFKQCCLRSRDHSRSRVDQVFKPLTQSEEDRRAAQMKARGRYIEMLHRAGVPLPWLSAFAITQKFVNNVNRGSLPAEFVELWDELVNNYCTEYKCEVPVDNTPVLEPPWISSADFQTTGPESAT